MEDLLPEKKLDNASETLRILAREVSRVAVENRRLAIASIETLLACSDVLSEDLKGSLLDEKAAIEDEQGRVYRVSDAADIAEIVAGMGYDEKMFTLVLMKAVEAIREGRLDEFAEKYFGAEQPDEQADIII